MSAKSTAEPTAAGCQRSDSIADSFLFRLVRAGGSCGTECVGRLCIRTQMYDDLSARIVEVRRMLTGLLKRLTPNALSSDTARARDAVAATGAAASSDS